jgi:DNA-binding beta-propeller fold protein YncE
MRNLVIAALAGLGLAMAGSARAAPCAYTAGAATVELPGRPFMAEASADGCWLFVSMGHLAGDKMGSGGVAVLHNEGGGFRVTHMAPLKDYPGGLAVSHDGKTLAVATEASVAILDIAKLEAGDAAALTATLPAGTGAIYLAISRDDRLLFVSEERRSRISVLDFAKARGSGEKAELGVIQVGRAPVGLALSTDGARLYATSESIGKEVFAAECQPEGGQERQHPEGVLTVIDVAAAGKDPAKSVLGVRKAGCNPVRVALSPDEATVWVTARGENRLEGFTARKLGGASTAAPDISVKVGAAPIGLAVRPDGKQIWVADSNRFGHNGPGELTAVSPAGQVLRTVPSGVFPRDIRFLPDGKTLVVAEYDSRAVQFVPTDAP